MLMTFLIVHVGNFPLYFSKKFLLRFFPKATKYFDLGIIIMMMMMMMKTTFLVHYVPKMYQKCTKMYAVSRF